MCLKDKIRHYDEQRGSSYSGTTKIKEPCKRYNRGKCTFGATYKYEHRCFVKKCGKFGHGTHICRL